MITPVKAISRTQPEKDAVLFDASARIGGRVYRLGTFPNLAGTMMNRQSANKGCKRRSARATRQARIHAALLAIGYRVESRRGFARTIVKDSGK